MNMINKSENNMPKHNEQVSIYMATNCGAMS